MIKKIALAAALAASTSFATYNFFPVGNTRTGQFEVGMQYGWTKDTKDLNVVLGAEYVVMDKLELSITNLGYQIFNEADDCDDYDACPDNDGFKALTVGARYWFMPMLGAALDINIPLTSKDVTGDYDPFGLYGAIQFSKELAPNLTIGSEAGLSYKFKDEETTEGLGLKIQAELDFDIPSIGLTPWIGGAFDIRLTDVKSGDDEFGSGDKAFTLWLGAGYKINPMLSVKANFIMKFADDDTMGSDWKGVNAKLDINF